MYHGLVMYHLYRSILAKFKEKLVGEICEHSGLGVAEEFHPEMSAVVKCIKQCEHNHGG